MANEIVYETRNDIIYIWNEMANEIVYETRNDIVYVENQTRCLRHIPKARFYTYFPFMVVTIQFSLTPVNLRLTHFTSVRVAWYYIVRHLDTIFSLPTPQSVLPQQLRCV